MPLQTAPEFQYALLLAERLTAGQASTEIYCHTASSIVLHGNCIELTYDPLNLTNLSMRCDIMDPKFAIGCRICE